jgi:glycosyltransferase involved in cell wall biosynthesis
MLSIVIPVYRNEESIPDLLLALEDLGQKFHRDFEVVFVVDGSPDRSYEILQKELPTASFNSKLILLTRNFGSFAAIRTGLKYTQGDYIAVMAADLQEPPEIVFEMEKLLQSKEDPADVVLGVRSERHDPWMSKVASQIFWGLYRKFVVKEMPPNGVDIFGCNRAFRDTLLTLDEAHSSLIAQIFWLGFRRKTVAYTRKKRMHGKSAWTFQKKLSYLADSVFAFTDLPIRFLIRGGMIGAISIALLGIIVFIAKLLGLITVPGYTVLVLVMSFIGATNLFALGIVGSYAWRAYENTKNRPIAIPLRIIKFEKHEHQY